LNDQLGLEVSLIYWSNLG